MADARLTALRGLNEVFGQGGYSNLVLESLMRKNELTGQERAFCTALFYGVVERRITLDWVLGRYSRQPVEKLSPAVRDILRMAVYQLLYMPSIPERAAVNEAVKETRAMRVSSASGYVNGVLRAFLRDGKKIALPREPLAALSVQYAVPKALITLWRQGYGEETTRAILEGCQSPAPLFIRVNSQKTTAEALMEKLAEENITAEKTPVENALRLEGAGDVTRLAAFPGGAVPCAGSFQPKMRRRAGCAARPPGAGCLLGPGRKDLYPGGADGGHRQPAGDGPISPPAEAGGGRRSPFGASLHPNKGERRPNLR